MGYLDTIVNPGGVSTASGPSQTVQPKGYLGSIVMPSVSGPTPTQIRTGNVQAATAASQVSKANADYANSFTGLATNTLKGLWSATGIPDQFNQGVQEYKENEPSYLGGTAQGGRGGGVASLGGALKAGEGVATAAFSPFAPVFKPISQAMDLVGSGKEPYSTKTVPSLSDIPAVQRFSNTPAGVNTAKVAGVVARAANVAGALGGAAEAFKPRVEGGFLDSVQTPGKEETPAAKPVEATPAEKPLAKTHAEYAKSMGYEPYTPHDQLPTIQVGKNESKLPTVQTEAPATRPARGDLKYEPIKEPIPSNVKSPATSRAGEPAQATTPKPEVPFSAEKVNEPGYKPLTPAESTGPTRTSTLASKVQAKAIAEGMSVDNSELPEYNQVNMKEQNAFAADLVANEPEKAMRIAMGEEPPPAHILPEKVFEAVEKKATLEGDGETLNKLATKSNMSSQATAMGQRIRALGDRDPMSPVRAIREVSEARKARATPTRVRDTVRQIRQAITPPTKDDWSSFIDDIKCNY